MILLTNKEVKKFNTKLNFLKADLVFYKLLTKLSPSLAKKYSIVLKKRLSKVVLSVHDNFHE
jgi:hypothetical protein